MNCKPGDLAVVIRSPLKPESLGKIVVVLRPYTGPQIWREPADWVVLCDGREKAADDAKLRPILNPGDDARDESLEWLPPVPIGTKEPA